MSRPLQQNPSPATARRRKNREAWRDARRFTGFSFEMGTYDRAKADWQRFREQHRGTPAGQATFTDWVAASMIAFGNLSPDERAVHVTAYMQANAANAPLPSFVPPTPEPEHPHTHVVLLNLAGEPAYRRRFEAFENGPVHPYRVRRWTVLRHVPSPTTRDGERGVLDGLFKSR